MNVRVMDAVWPLQVSPTQKAVMVSLADRANKAGICWPSVRDICERTCLSERAVQKAMRDLERLGHLRIERSHGRSNRFEVLPNAISLAHQMHPSTSCTPAAGAEPPQQVQEVVRQEHPNRKEPLKNHQAEKREGAYMRGTRLPADWRLSRGDSLFAKSQGVDPHTEADRFRDYWHAAAGDKARKRDWSAAWRNWIRRAVDFAPNSHQSRSSRAETEKRNGQVASAWSGGKAKLGLQDIEAPFSRIVGQHRRQGGSHDE